MNNKEKFILKANKKHSNKYDYSLVKYINSQIKVKIICPDHGIFEMKPNNHTRSGCPKCKGELIRSLKVKSTDQYIIDAKKIHGDKYDYSLVNYITAHDKIKIICTIHGIFEQIPNNHLNGANCQKCVGNNIMSSTEEFIRLSKEIYGDKYDYSLVDYKNNKTNVKIICDGKVYEQSPKSHLKGMNVKSLTKDEFIRKSKESHGDKYDYSLVEFDNTNDYIKIICPIHGIFEKMCYTHYKCGCPLCSESVGEKNIRLFLNNKNIKYKPQMKFDNCIKINRLSFDFYLYDYNTCIEYDGKQHFEPNDFFGGIYSYLKQVEHDEIKNEYCKNNNIRLIRIRYDENIIEKLTHFLF